MAQQAPLVVAEEYADFAGSRRRIDLLAVDPSGQLVVVELKRPRTAATWSYRRCATPPWSPR